MKLDKIALRYADNVFDAEEERLNNELKQRIFKLRMKLPSQLAGLMAPQLCDAHVTHIEHVARARIAAVRAACDKAGVFADADLVEDLRTEVTAICSQLAASLRRNVEREIGKSSAADGLLDFAITQAASRVEALVSRLSRELEILRDELELVRRSSKTDKSATQSPTVQSAAGHRFDVALSFAGEDRELVGAVANELAAALGRERVFYDKFYEAELARPNLDLYLQQIYATESELLVGFLSANYVEKEWCQTEWRVFREVLKTRGPSELMLFRSDTATVPGVFSIDGYVDGSGKSAAELAALVLERLQLGRESNRSSPHSR